MSLKPGTLLGVYEIGNSLGAGGMGEVYRARDSRLERDVAIKILPPGMASEPEALVIAFKNDSRVYFVSEYRVTQRIEGGQVRLEKEPAATAERISRVKES